MECGYPGGCDRPPQKKFTRGMCHYHYKKAMAEGDISHITTPTPTLCERFEGKVDKQGGYPDFSDPYTRVTKNMGECWLWTGAATSAGYGRFKVAGKTHQATRMSLVIYRSWTPDPQLDVDHLCRRPECVNPDHLEPVTRQENVLRGATVETNRAKRREFCGKGHPMRGENVIAYRGGGGRCRTCQNEKNREWMRAYRARA